MELLIVTGMHRSGTSLAAGLLHDAGWDIGPPEQLMEPKPDNPKGFVEHLPAVRVNDQLLHRLGGSWKQPPALARDWAKGAELDELRDQAATVVADLAQRRSDRVLLKDPRFSLTLPFWQTVVEIPRIVLVVRPPRAVIRSLTSRTDDLDARASGVLYTHYLLAALRHDTELHLLRTDELAADPPATLSSLTASLGHPMTEEALSAARSSIDEGLWGRTSSDPVSGEDADPAVEAATALHRLITTDLDRWRPVLSGLRTSSEFDAASQALIDVREAKANLQVRHDAMRDQRDRSAVRVENLLERVERAKEETAKVWALHDDMRDQRDAAVGQRGTTEDRKPDATQDAT